jgi:hypothetical protein
VVADASVATLAAAHRNGHGPARVANLTLHGDGTKPRRCSYHLFLVFNGMGSARDELTPLEYGNDVRVTAPAYSPRFDDFDGQLPLGRRNIGARVLWGYCATCLGAIVAGSARSARSVPAVRL